jgi:interferon-induced helicase C domain-containing protein 1
LAKEAVEGKNVIICAPTGSGKTIVGAFIVREHLINAIQSGQKAKVHPNHIENKGNLIELIFKI